MKQSRDYNDEKRTDLVLLFLDDIDSVLLFLDDIDSELLNLDPDIYSRFLTRVDYYTPQISVNKLISLILFNLIYSLLDCNNIIQFSNTKLVLIVKMSFFDF